MVRRRQRPEIADRVRLINVTRVHPDHNMSNIFHICPLGTESMTLLTFTSRPETLCSSAVLTFMFPPRPSARPSWNMRLDVPQALRNLKACASAVVVCDKDNIIDARPDWHTNKRRGPCSPFLFYSHLMQSDPLPAASEAPQPSRWWPNTNQKPPHQEKNGGKWRK